jgi:diketogulonate reductase-like aldo/keto reductase
MLNEFYTLANGLNIPKIGLGTYQMSGETCRVAVRAALQLGYRHIDSAVYYSNHKEIAQEISSFDRSSLFLTSKIPPPLQGYEKTMEATLRSLSELRTEYLDLMLIHWPGVAGLAPNDPQVVETRHGSWRALEDLYLQGKLKAIGVSNFLIRHLEKLEKVARVQPMVNQFEYHPWCHDDDLVNYCHSKGIIVEAYSSLARAEPALWNTPKLEEISKKTCKTKSQVLLRWGLQKGCIVLPKSNSPARVQENADLAFTLSPSDMQDLNNFHSNRRTCWDPTTIQV